MEYGPLAHYPSWIARGQMPQVNMEKSHRKTDDSEKASQNIISIYNTLIENRKMKYPIYLLTKNVKTMQKNPTKNQLSCNLREWFNLLRLKIY